MAKTFCVSYLQIQVLALPVIWHYGKAEMLSNKLYFTYFFLHSIWRYIAGNCSKIALSHGTD